MTELLFKDGHTEKISEKIQVGNADFNSETMIPLVVSISIYCQNTSSQWNCSGSFYYNGKQIARVGSSPQSGTAHRTKGEFNGVIYLPYSFDNFEQLQKVGKFTSNFSYNDYGGITVKVLQWIER